MRISLDTDVCIGAGQCALLSPDVFTQDVAGLGSVVPGARAAPDGPWVRAAARACPVGAITLAEP